MLITYIIALTLVAILLCGAVRLHFSFGLHRAIKEIEKEKEIVPYVERTPHLHDYIFAQS